MKKIFVLAVCALFFSCASSPVFLPGEKRAEIKNIYSEYFVLAQEHEQLKNYSKAIEFYKIAMNEKSLRDAAYYKLGRCCVLDKRYKEAESIFLNILEKDPGNVSVKSSLAYTAAQSGDTERACRLYSELVQENPYNADVLVNYISVLIACKDYETAKINLEFLEKKFPGTAQTEDLKKALESETAVNAGSEPQ